MEKCIICTEKFKKNYLTTDGMLRQLCDNCDAIFTNKYGPGGWSFCAQLKNLSGIMRAMQYSDVYSSKTIKCSPTSIEKWSAHRLIFPHKKYYNYHLEKRDIIELKTFMQTWILNDYDLFYVADLTQGTRNTLFHGSRVMRKEGC